VKILNIVPTFDPGVGAASVRRFEKEARDRGNVVVLRACCKTQDMKICKG
jgi:peroxiredoxin